MPMVAQVRRALGRLAGWWRSQVSDVPPDLGACEFDCRERQCAAETFDACDHRLQHAQAVGGAVASPDGAAAAAAVRDPAAPVTAMAAKPSLREPPPIDAVRAL